MSSLVLLWFACVFGYGCGNRQRKCLGLQRPQRRVRRLWQGLAGACCILAWLGLAQNYSLGVACAVALGQLMLAGMSIGVMVAWRPDWCRWCLLITGAQRVGRR